MPSIADFIAGASGGDLAKLRKQNPIVFGGIGPNVSQGKQMTEVVRKAMLGKINKGKYITEGAAGKPDEGIELMKNISKLPGGQRLNDTLAGVQSGFGSATIVRTKDSSGAGLTSVLDIGVTSNPSTRPIVVPSGQGAFAVMPSAGTAETGRGLITAYNRAKDIKQRQYDKVRASARAQSNFGRGPRRRGE